MTTIETTGAVTSDHKLVVHDDVPSDIPPGEHQIVVLIGNRGEGATALAAEIAQWEAASEEAWDSIDDGSEVGD